MRNEIKNHRNPKVPEIATDLEKAMTLFIAANNEAGKMMKKSLLQDLVSDLEAMLSKSKTATMQEFVAYCESIKVKWTLLRSMVDVKKDKEYLQTLLKEEMEREV